MSTKLEEAFRTALENQEVPFDPKAWDAINAQLDKIMPVSPKGGASSWWVAAGVAGVVGIGAAFYFSSTEADDSSETVKQMTTKQVEKTDDQKTIFDKNETKQARQAGVNENQPDAQLVNDQTPAKKYITNGTSDYGSPAMLPDASSATCPTDAKKESASNNEQNEEKNSTIDGFRLPTISAKCQGESIHIENSNVGEIVCLLPSGKKVIIAPKTVKKIQLNEVGVYALTGGRSSTTFQVNGVQKVDFELSDAGEFVAGVPTLVATAVQPSPELNWAVKGKNINARGAEAVLHFFEKGSYELILSNSKNGCISSVSKNIVIDEDYNLLAVSGIRPMDSDSRTKTFMPFALTQRNTPFQLVIINPRDGKIMFQSNDKNIGWDGIDKSTGKLVPAHSDYRWNVTLEKPLQGEKQKYSGSITVVY